MRDDRCTDGQRNLPGGVIGAIIYNNDTIGSAYEVGDDRTDDSALVKGCDDDPDRPLGGATSLPWIHGPTLPSDALHPNGEANSDNDRELNWFLDNNMPGRTVRVKTGVRPVPYRPSALLRATSICTGMNALSMLTLRNLGIAEHAAHCVE